MRMCSDNRSTVALIGLIDISFGAILFSLYLQTLLFFPVGEFSTMPSLKLLLLFPIILNIFQIIISYHLIMSAKQVDLLVSLSKAILWLQGSVLILIFLCLKLFLLIFFPFQIGGSRKNINMAIMLTVGETIFKIVSLYIVRGYMEVLKLQSYQPPLPPPLQYFSIYVPPSQECQESAVLHFPNYLNKNISSYKGPSPLMQNSSVNPVYV